MFSYRMFHVVDVREILTLSIGFPYSTFEIFKSFRLLFVYYFILRRKTNGTRKIVAFHYFWFFVSSKKSIPLKHLLIHDEKVDVEISGVESGEPKVFLIFFCLYVIIIFSVISI